MELSRTLQSHPPIFEQKWGKCRISTPVLSFKMYNVIDSTTPLWKKGGPNGGAYRDATCTGSNLHWVSSLPGPGTRFKTSISFTLVNAAIDTFYQEWRKKRQTGESNYHTKLTVTWIIRVDRWAYRSQSDYHRWLRDKLFSFWPRRRMSKHCPFHRDLAPDSRTGVSC